MEITINTQLNVNYRVGTSTGVFNKENEMLLLATYTGGGISNRRLLVIDKKVNELYRPKIDAYFDHHKLTTRVVVLDGVEAKKDSTALFHLLNEMEQFGISRRDEPIIGIGGGVILDVVGMAASVYRRGVPYIRIPTTLLGIVDVSIAAKTGINWEGRRNRLGSYYPPVCALLDKEFIKTQDPIEISSGMGEILKIAVIKDASLFDLLEKHGAELLASKFDHEYADSVIGWSVIRMKEELENNLWERNLRRCVDFGHSFSPIIEMRSLPTDSPLPHGHAVTIDVVLSCIISMMRGLLHETDVNRITRVADAMGIPTTHPMFKDVSLLLESLNDTTKHRGGSQNLPVPTKIGEHIFINDLTFDEICEAAKRL